MIKAELNVKRKEFLAPKYLRIFLEGENISLFRNVQAGVNCKLIIDNNDNEKPQISRTYTFRGIDLENQEIWVDFIIDDTMGPMTHWAKNSVKGNKIIIATRDENPPLYIPSDWYLLAGDSVSIPILASLLESLPETANGYCFINATDQDVEVPLISSSNIKIEWIFGNQESFLKRIKTLPIPEGSKFGIIASELTVAKDIRSYLNNEVQWNKASLKALPFWKRGSTEDESSDERHKEAGVS